MEVKFSAAQISKCRCSCALRCEWSRVNGVHGSTRIDIFDGQTVKSRRSAAPLTGPSANPWSLE